MFRLHRPRFRSARVIAARLGVPVDTFLRLCEQHAAAFNRAVGKRGGANDAYAYPPDFSLWTHA